MDLVQATPLKEAWNHSPVSFVDLRRWVINGFVCIGAREIDDLLLEFPGIGVVFVEKITSLSKRYCR